MTTARMFARFLRVLPLLIVAAAFGYLVGAARQSANAAPPAPKENACGCYQDGTGACFCGKKAKCGCPGDCEPKGCEEKRAKELEKEIQAETKRAQDAERKQRESKNNSEAPKKKSSDMASPESEDEESEAETPKTSSAPAPAQRKTSAQGQCPPCPCADAKKTGAKH